MDIKIVGSITDENTLEEIENILKIFAYEQRMKYYTSPIHTQCPKNEVKILNEKITEKNKFISRSQPHILVKGLC